MASTSWTLAMSSRNIASGSPKCRELLRISVCRAYIYIYTCVTLLEFFIFQEIILRMHCWTNFGILYDGWCFSFASTVSSSDQMQSWSHGDQDTGRFERRLRLRFRGTSLCFLHAVSFFVINFPRYSESIYYYPSSSSSVNIHIHPHYSTNYTKIAQY